MCAIFALIFAFEWMREIFAINDDDKVLNIK